MIAYKVLRSDGRGIFTSFRWSLPVHGPGPWVEAAVEPCRSGIHACRREDLPLWLGHVLYEVELGGEVVQARSKVVASRARLVRPLDAWDDAARTAYTRMCADRAHELAASSPTLSVWDAAIEPSVAEGPALLGFVAARIAEEVGGIEGYRAERCRQVRWLAERLGLPASP